jgi:serine/threonine-protein phosphatase PGAM5
MKKTKCPTTRPILLSLFFIIAVVLPLSMYLHPVYAKEAKTPRRPVRTIYLIRHGEYDQKDEQDSHTGKGLIPLGIAQARLTAARRRSLPVKMTSLYSSTMTRARETALVIGEDFPELKLEQSPLLDECTPPTWRKDIMAEESLDNMNTCRQQLEKAFSKFFTPAVGTDKNDIIVSHGNAIRYLVTRVLKVNSLSWLGMAIGNCSLTVVRIDPDGSMRLLAFSDVGHLPFNMQTGLDDVERNLVVPNNE